LPPGEFTLARGNQSVNRAFAPQEFILPLGSAGLMGFKQRFLKISDWFAKNHICPHSVEIEL
jgi:hypothetical protein